MRQRPVGTSSREAGPAASTGSGHWTKPGCPSAIGKTTATTTPARGTSGRLAALRPAHTDDRRTELSTSPDEDPQGERSPLPTDTTRNTGASGEAHRHSWPWWRRQINTGTTPRENSRDPRAPTTPTSPPAFPLQTPSSSSTFHSGAAHGERCAAYAKHANVFTLHNPSEVRRFLDAAATE